MEKNVIARKELDSLIRTFAVLPLSAIKENLIFILESLGVKVLKE